MAKLPTYQNVTLNPPKAGAEPPRPERRAARPAGGTLKEAASQLVLYISPAAAKALKLYAATNDAKVHDLLIEAVEGWFHKHGLREQVRAKPVKGADA